MYRRPKCIDRVKLGAQSHENPSAREASEKGPPHVNLHRDALLERFYLYTLTHAP